MTFLPNSIEGKAAPFLERIENLHDVLESEKGFFMARAKAIRADVREVYTEAKEAGVPAKALKGVVRYRQLEKKQKAISAGLDVDEVSSYEILVEMLGDFATTDLGAAAVSGATRKAAKKFTDVMGQPVPLTDEEKAQGVVAAFVDKDGMRSSIGGGAPPKKAKNGAPAEPDAKGIADEIERQEIAAQKERDGEAFEDSAAA